MIRAALLALLLTLAVTSAASAAVVPVTVRDDTFVHSGQPTTNFGSSTVLQVDGEVPGNAAERERRGLLYFSGHQTNQPLDVRKVTCSGWNAATVTYNTQPALGPVIATYPNDDLGDIEVDLPAGTVTGGSVCFALTKAGTLWMNVSSEEAGQPAELVVTTEDAPPPPPPPDSPVQRCGGTPISVTPSTISSAINSRDSGTYIAQPGSYGSLRVYPSSAKSCVEIRCSVAAKSGDFGRNASGCTSTRQWVFGAIRNLTIEQFSFITSDDYGVQLYDESPHVGMKTRIAENVFNGNMFHDISTKNQKLYTEVLSNYFISCMRHCWEVGQNGNIPSRPSTTDTSIFRGNKVSSRIQGIAQRYNKTLIVEGNEFRSVAGYAVITEPFWARYPDPSTGELNMIPEGPLRTNITGNSFSTGNRMLFVGRGSLDDVVLIKANTGTVPACRRGDMNSRNSGTSAAHSNEQTLAPPQLDPTSDIPCPA